MTKPSVLLVGPGGVGAVVAYSLDTNGKVDLSIVVRRDYETVTKNGYEFHSVDFGEVKGWKPPHIYPDIDHAVIKGGYDYVVITTKNYPDILKLEDLVEPVITPGKTTIVLIQNGFDNGRPFIAKYPKNFCLSGVSHIGSHNIHGVVTQTQQDKELISFFDNKTFSADEQKAKALEFIELYRNDVNNVTYFPDVKFYRYRKLVYNATMNTTCSLTQVDAGRLELSGTLETVSIPAMREVIAVAKADGVTLPEDTINNVVHSDDGDWFKPSMLVDTQKGNPIELEVILGNLLRVARELKVSTPTLDVLYHLLKAVQFRLKEGKGMFTLPEKRPIGTKHYS